MVQLHILSGKMADQQILARHFPFWIGRSETANLRLQEDAVWDRHFRIEFVPPAGFVLTTDANAFVTLNGQQVHHAVLKSGDLIEIGLLKLRFSLSPTRQRHLATREVLTWTSLAVLCLVQIGIIYWLLQ
jgi:hypothetical protein